MFRFIQDFLTKMGQKNKHNVEEKYLIKYKSLVQPEVFKALLAEYASGDIVFEPIRNKLSETEMDNLYLRIDKANFLSHQEKFETIVVLMYLIDGSFPESEVILSRFKKIFGEEFINTIEKKRKSFADKIAIKKVIRFIKTRNFKQK